MTARTRAEVPQIDPADAHEICELVRACAASPDVMVTRAEAWHMGLELIAGSDGEANLQALLERQLDIYYLTDHTARQSAKRA